MEDLYLEIPLAKVEDDTNSTKPKRPKREIRYDAGPLTFSHFFPDPAPVGDLTDLQKQLTDLGIEENIFFHLLKQETIGCLTGGK